MANAHNASVHGVGIVLGIVGWGEIIFLHHVGWSHCLWRVATRWPHSPVIIVSTRAWRAPRDFVGYVQKQSAARWHDLVRSPSAGLAAPDNRLASASTHRF